VKSGYNPTRRNRNIGTAEQGRGRDNRLSIPWICHAERIWWEQIGNYQFHQRDVHGSVVSFIVEETSAGCIHACSIADVVTFLSALPAEDLSGMTTFVFRQPTKKQRTLRPVWGRMAYFAEIGRATKTDSRTGPAIFLDAQAPLRAFRWSKSLDSDHRQELERLASDGHRIEDTGKIFKIHSTPESIRNTQLYRTLPHEIGHWVDWLEKVIRPSGDDDEMERTLSDRYFSRARNEGEVFAHRYAESTATLLKQRNVIPFSST
jgi:hypothetical protein